LSATAGANDGRDERPFDAGGQIRFDLSAGDYTIKAGRTDRILVEWRTPADDSRGRVSITADAGRKTATVLTNGPRNNFNVLIEIPSMSDVRVNLSAGDLRVLGITGDKDLGSWAGDIDVDVPRAEDYGHVDARVTAGDITAPSFGAARSGLFRSFAWDGPGRYTLRVRLTAGDLRLYPAEAASR
jgi:hypothetical protein